MHLINIRIALNFTNGDDDVRKIIGGCIVALALTGCADKMGDPSLKAEAEAPLTCSNDKDCSLYWQRAQFWVANNSAWKIQSATDTLISTYNPTPNSPMTAYQVSKLPKGDGTARIFIKPYCDNVFGCQPKPYEAVVSFKRFVKNGS